MDDGPQTEEDKTKMTSKPYRSLIGSLMDLACGTRPDISVVDSKLNRFLENPGGAHLNAEIKAKKVGITYDGLLGTELTAYTDADWASNRDDRRSVTGMMILMCGAPVVWRSTFQKIVALSSTESEYMDLSEFIKEVVWLRRLLKDIGAEQVDSTVIYEDNRGGIALAKNIGYQARIKHIGIRYHFIGEKVSTGEIELVYETSKNLLVDFLTGGLSSKMQRGCGSLASEKDKTLRYLVARGNMGPKIETSN
ncbi:polyprotein [Phytophthora megakarya]|uniref:Polyprotein n=1 Tax=Phytophthora megakarya TaxID=4795 RepID=A0A225UQP9_9STRA|nr:polyprotein [Phytophthora megakarya]